MKSKSFVAFLLLAISAWTIFIIKCINIPSVDPPSSFVKSNLDTASGSTASENVEERLTTSILTTTFGQYSTQETLVESTPLPSDAESIERNLVHPPHMIEYGNVMASGKRTPLVMIRANLSVEVHQSLLNQDLFQSEESQLANYKMIKAVDYVRAKDTHFYYEGYFHSMLTSDSILSRNPRSGQEFQKPAANPFIRAFYESVRRNNNQTFALLQNRLRENAKERSPSDSSRDMCGMLSDWIQQGRLFGDISIQLHYGSHIHGGMLFWHTDAENSLLHLGVTVMGRRILHSRRGGTNKGGEVPEVLEDQLPGAFYLSSSALMNHAPEYPACNWPDRIIALQGRLLYTTAQLKRFRAVRTDAAWQELTRILAETLSQSPLALPTLDDIQKVMAEI